MFFFFATFKIFFSSVDDKVEMFQFVQFVDLLPLHFRRHIATRKKYSRVSRGKKKKNQRLYRSSETKAIKVKEERTKKIITTLMINIK